jgi:anaerobic magnesium-protoporphyrin IX monomethyl ester cyclase
VTALRLSERTGRPLALLGSTWAFDHFFDACRAEGVRFRLPAGSRIVESGGYVGRYARCSPDELIGKCRDILGVREEYCINALWLCESSTVYFDNVLRDSFAGVRRPRTKQSPPWCRTIVIDPFSMKRLPKGRTGLLRHYDLTNRAMAIAVQTGNLGYETEEGFEVVGKWNGNVKNPAIDALPGHPGGRILSSLMDSFLRRKFSSIGRIYSSLA